MPTPRTAVLWFFVLSAISCRRAPTPIGVDAALIAVAAEDAGAVSAAAFAPDGGPLAGVTATRRNEIPGIDEMSGLYALAAATDAPASRDDDLSTAWRCEPAATGRCALELKFAEPADVKMLRVFTRPADPERHRRFDTRTHPATIHLDAGFVAASLSDTQDYQYVALDPPVRTAALAIEVSSADPVSVAEIEVFGAAGTKREPLRIDPRRLIVRAGGALFPAVHGEPGDGAAPTWIELVDGQSDSHPVLVGSRIDLKLGDRIALVREVSGASCPGAYYEEFGETMVVDLETRAIGRLLGAVGMQAFRSTNGRGVGVLSSPDRYETCRYDSVACAPSGYVKRGGVVACGDEGSALLRARGMRPYEPAMPKGCRAPTEGEIAAATVPDESAGIDTSCEGPNGLRVLVGSRVCDEGAKIVIVDSALRIVWRASNDVGMAQAKRLEDGRLILSVDKGGTSEIDVLEGGRLRTLFSNATFGVAQAPGCRCSA